MRAVASPSVQYSRDPAAASADAGAALSCSTRPPMERTVTPVLPASTSTPGSAIASRSRFSSSRTAFTDSPVRRSVSVSSCTSDDSANDAYIDVHSQRRPTMPLT